MCEVQGIESALITEENGHTTETSPIISTVVALNEANIKMRFPDHPKTRIGLNGLRVANFVIAALSYIYIQPGK